MEPSIVRTILDKTGIPAHWFTYNEGNIYISIPCLISSAM